MSFKRNFIQIVCIGALILHASADSATSSAAASSRGDAPHFAITWVGGPTMVISFGDFTVLTDPTLGETFAMGDPNDPADHERIISHRRLTPVRGLDLRAVDLVVLSHIHPDHFDEHAAATLDHALPVILPAADKAAVVAKGFNNVESLNWGDTRQFVAGRGQVRITAVPARHSRNPKMAEKLGKGNGYWIEFSHDDWKRSLYWTGDSMATEDVVSAVKSRGTPDVLVPNVGGVGSTGPLGQISMKAADVLALARALQPKYVLPIHHSTYAFYREPISELEKQSAGLPYRLNIIPAGSTVVYE